jgi:hypothetical protein
MTGYDLWLVGHPGIETEKIKRQKQNSMEGWWSQWWLQHKKSTNSKTMYILLGGLLGLDPGFWGTEFIFGSSIDSGWKFMFRVSTYNLYHMTNTYKSVLLLTMQALRGRGDTDLTQLLTSTLDAGEWSVSLPQPRFTPGKDPWYPLDKRLGGPQSWSGHRGQRKNPLPLLGIEPQSSSL